MCSTLTSPFGWRHPRAAEQVACACKCPRSGAKLPARTPCQAAWRPGLGRPGRKSMRGRHVRADLGLSRSVRHRDGGDELPSSRCLRGRAHGTGRPGAGAARGPVVTRNLPALRCSGADQRGRSIRRSGRRGATAGRGRTRVGSRCLPARDGLAPRDHAVRAPSRRWGGPLRGPVGGPDTGHPVDRHRAVVDCPPRSGAPEHREIDRDRARPRVPGDVDQRLTPGGERPVTTSPGRSSLSPGTRRA